MTLERISAWAVFGAGLFGTSVSTYFALIFASGAPPASIFMCAFSVMFAALTFCGSYLVETSR